MPGAVNADVEAAPAFFCFFFLLFLGAGESALAVEFEGGAWTVEDLLLSVLTVRSEEISNMVGTERNSRCVIPLLSSSEREGEWREAAFMFSPTFFFLRDDTEFDEERSSGPEVDNETGGVGLENGGG